MQEDKATHPLVDTLKKSHLEELAGGIADRLVADELPQVTVVTTQVTPSKGRVTVKGAETEAKGLVNKEHALIVGWRGQC